MLICLLAILIRILLIIARIPLGIFMVAGITCLGIKLVLKAIGINFSLRLRRTSKGAPEGTPRKSFGNLREKSLTAMKKIPSLLTGIFHAVKEFLVSKGLGDSMSAVLAAIVVLIII